MWGLSLLLVAIEASLPLVPESSASPPVCACDAAFGCNGHELRAESAHFVVTSYREGPCARYVASRCENTRSQLRCDCLGRSEPLAWEPKCQIVLHSSQSSYRRATGQGSGQTVGSSLINIRSGRVSERRIDLLATDAKQALSAVPHELTHVLLADVFPASPPPRWAEEGLALLADPADKRARHARDLRRALQTNTTLPLATFFTNADYPAARDRAVFYAQSMSLAEYLVALDSPQRFVEFVELGERVGHAAALRRIYDIQGLAELENKWLRYAASQSVAPVVVPVSQREL